MEIRDILHGSIPIDPLERGVLDSRYFQRLRQIKQLGFAENSFPSATHNRYIHSLGAMHTASQGFESIFGKASGQGALPDLPAQARERLRAATRLAALLHDVGHGPLSHTTEFAMPDARELGIPGLPLKRGARKATHEDYTLKILLDSGLTPILERAGKPLGLKPTHVASLVDPSVAVGDDFFIERVNGTRIDFRPILKQLISSELDADRMDYLRRDSLHAGVTYGHFDFGWLLANLTAHVKDGACYLALQHRALYSFEDFLLSRYHMFLMVYFHYKSVVFDEMLAQYFASEDCDYQLPADIERYCECDDAHLAAHLAQSTNPWARRITEKRPYRLLVELHSGIPNTKTALQEQARLMARIQRELGGKQIDFLESTSTGELSKYFRKPGDPIFVKYDNLYSAPSFIALEQCTDLFTKYSEKRSITRLYVSPENFAACRRGGGDQPMRFEDLQGSELDHAQMH